MAEEPNNQNSWSAPQSPDSSSPSDAGSSVPPPPPEVKVRTLRSDLESMAQSGGMSPQFRNIKAPVIESGGNVLQTKTNANSVWLAIMIVVAVLLVFGVAYFAYKLFFAGTGTNRASYSIPFFAAQEPSTASSGKAPTTQPPATAAFIHRSLLKQPADQILAISLPRGTAGNAADLETFSQKVQKVLSGANATSTFFEITAKDINGSDLLLDEVWSAGDMEVVDPLFLASHFSNDTTFFLYKDKSGVWPGFILSLKTGENWLFVKDDIAKLESSPKLINFFLTLPGTPASAGFQDTIESGQPARILKFSSATASSSFVYGWLHNVLILSTSEDGLKAAVARL